MFSRWTYSGFFAGLLICASCQSKPTSTHSGKATRGATGPLYSVELEAEVPLSPRGGNEIEPAVILNPGVQACLREAILKSGDEFVVAFAGRINSKGAVSDVSVDHEYETLRDCLGSALARLNLGKGDAGPFKMQISRVRTTPPKSKTFLLDMVDPKKFQ